MNESRKIAFRAMVIASAVIALAQTLLLALKADRGTVFALVIAAAEVGGGALIAYCVLHPELNRQYTPHKQNGKLKMTRVTYGADPHGLRYISAGFAVLLTAMMFAVVAAGVLWPEVVAGNVTAAAIVVLCVALCVIFSTIENKLRKQDKQ